MFSKSNFLSKKGTHSKKELKEHILIHLWVDIEDVNNKKDSHINEVNGPVSTELIEELKKERYVVEQEGVIKFTPAGEEYAEKMIRRHRLAEVLFSEVLSIEESSARSQVCEFEHFLTPDVTESICTFLGHPLECPHGKLIPRGGCCAAFKKEMGPLIKPVVDLKIGDSGKIVFMTPKTHLRLDKLMTFGITPGSIIKLHQKKPSIVLQIGETDLAIDFDVAKNIYVKNANGGTK
ncbi:metal-dependent transcriptional regulator [candidate division KSB1 bacterium]